MSFLLRRLARLSSKSNSLLQKLQKNAKSFADSMGFKLRPKHQQVSIPNLINPQTKKLQQLKAKLKPFQQTKTFLNPDGQVVGFIQNRLNDLRQQNRKKQTFDRYQFMRGQIGIQYTPLQDHLKFKNQIQLRKKKIKNSVTLKFNQLSNRNKKYGWKMGLTLWAAEIFKRQKFNDIYKLGEIIRNYPGTKKGPNPQDDPQGFQLYLRKSVNIDSRNRVAKYLQKIINNQYFPLQTKMQVTKFRNVFYGIDVKVEKQNYNKKIPIIRRKKILKKQELNPQFQHLVPKPKKIKNYKRFSKNAISQNFKDEKSEYEISSLPQQNYEYDYLFQQRYRYPTDKIIKPINTKRLDTSIKRREDQLPTLNPNFPQEIPYIVEQVDKWEKLINFVAAQPRPQDFYQFTEINVKPKTLYNYYRTLPKQLQENYHIRFIYVLLQHRSRNTLEQKQEYLNQACQLVQPLDQLTEKAMSVGSIGRHFGATQQGYKKALKMKPRQLLRQEMFFQILFGQQKSKPKKLHYHIQGEQPLVNNSLPVDYYINDDGFWDQYIAEKNKLYDQVPITLTRTHFKH